MGKQYSIAQARDHLPAIVHEVEQGQPVELTGRGKPVAVLLSATEYKQLSRSRPSFMEALERWRQSADFEAIDVDEWLEGVREESPGREFQW